MSELNPTREQIEAAVLDALCPTGATVKYGAIVAHVADTFGCYSGYEWYLALSPVTQRMKREGKIQFVKGVGSGWRRPVVP